MKVGEPASRVMPLERPQQSLDRDVQSVFSDVLAAAAVPGYRSVQEYRPADQATADLPLDQRATQLWDDWFSQQQTGRYRSIFRESAAQGNALGQTFGQLLSRAYHKGGYADPKQFLSQLSADELESIRQVHGLVDRVHVPSLSHEGALNLLIPPVAQVDLNGDGLTQSGAAYGIRSLTARRLRTWSWPGTKRRPG